MHIVSDDTTLDTSEVIVYKLLKYDSLRKLSFKYMKNMAGRFVSVSFVPM